MNLFHLHKSNHELRLLEIPGNIKIFILRNEREIDYSNAFNLFKSFFFFVLYRKAGVTILKNNI